MKDWTSVQFRQGHLLQVNEDSNWRIVNCEVSGAVFPVGEGTLPGERRAWSALCAISGGTAILTGGLGSGQHLKTCLAFSESNGWSEVPHHLNVARAFHSCASLDKQVFVFGGVDEHFEPQSLEWISLSSLEQPQAQGWQVLQLSEISTRLWPLVAPLTGNELLIAGGSNRDGLKGDAFVVNSQTKACSRLFNNAASFKFYAMGNQSAMCSSDSAVALVTQDGDRDKPCLIRFSKGENQFTVLAEYYGQ